MTRLSFDRTFAIATTVAVVAGVAAGFWVLGTPGNQRAIAADRQRIQNLQAIAQQLHVEYRQTEDPKDYQLPPQLANIDALRPEYRFDPLTQQPYEYERLGDQTYRLCATFDTDSSTYPLNEPPPPGRDRWQHPQGRHCFEFEVSTDPYAPLP